VRLTAIEERLAALEKPTPKRAPARPRATARTPKSAAGKAKSS
jgi:hypothetical protein